MFDEITGKKKVYIKRKINNSICSVLIFENILRCCHVDWMKGSFFPSSRPVDTAVWMHYMDANKTYIEKAWRQAHMNAASNIEQYIRNTAEKLGRTHKRYTHVAPSHRQAKAGRPTRTYIQQLCADTGWSLEDLPEAMDDREGCGRGSGISVLMAWQYDDDLKSFNVF